VHLLWYLCYMQDFAAPVREDSNRDGSSLQTVPERRTHFLCWKDEALCSLPVWATPLNYGSHCCPSESKMGELGEKLKTKKWVNKKARGDRDAARVVTAFRCTDVHWSREDIKPKHFISPCHNGNQFVSNFKKLSHHAPSFIHLYTSDLKLHMVTRK